MFGPSDIIAVGTFVVSMVGGAIGIYLKLRGQIAEASQRIDVLQRESDDHLSESKPLMREFVELRTRYSDLIATNSATVHRAERERQEIMAALKELNAKIDHLTRRVYSGTSDSA